MRIRFFTALLAFTTGAAVLAAEPDRPCQADARQGRPALSLPEGVHAERSLEYVIGGGAAQSLDLYLPAKSDQPLPLIVWIHGGGWSGGTKEMCPAVPFAGQGYAVASINYHLSSQAIFPAQIQDCLAAIRWLRANSKKYNLDANHVGVWGSSAGGHLVALVGTAGGKKVFPAIGGNEDQSDRVQAVCDWFGPTDFTKMDAQTPGQGRMHHDSPESPESHLIGGAIQENKDKVLLANPIHYVTKDVPPFLIMHGSADMTVPPGQSDIFAEALKNAGAEVLLQKLPGAGHGGPSFNLPASFGLVARFFDKHLKGKDVKVELLPDEALALPPGARQAPDAGRGRDNPPADRNAPPVGRARADLPQPLVGAALENLAGFTEDQKAKIIEIRKKYRELLFKEHDEIMAVLTEAQRKELSDNNTRAAHDRIGAGGREGLREAAPRGVFPSVQATITKLEVPNIWIQLEREGVPPGKVTADENTVITLDGKPAVFADLKVGQHVAVDHPTGTAARIEASSATPAPAKK